MKSSVAFLIFCFFLLFLSLTTSVPLKSLSNVVWSKKKILLGSQRITVHSTKLRFGVVKKSLSSSESVIEIQTRGFNGQIPGPIMSMKRGQYYEVILQNSLENPDDIEFSEDFHFNTFRYPNFTNIHLHGLHVSPLPGSDYPFEVISPGHSFRYIFHIPENHMGGTFWYHPHLHGIHFFC